jgi:hypothetical protein
MPESSVTPIEGQEPAANPRATTAAAPVEITTTTPISGTASSVAVTVPNTSGTVTFQLVVTDNLGTVSTNTAQATVTIQGPPTAVLTATPAVVADGGTIELSGAGSTSSGTIANYKFSLVAPT